VFACYLLENGRNYHCRIVSDCIFLLLRNSWMHVVVLTEGGTPPAVSSAGLTAPPVGSAAQGICWNDTRQ